MIRSNIMDLKNKRGKVLHHKLPPRLVDSYGRLPTTSAQFRKTQANLRNPILAKRIYIARARRIEAERIRVGALRRRTASFLILSHNELARRAQGQARRAQGKTDTENFGSDRIDSHFSLVTCRLRKIVDCVRVAKSKRKPSVTQFRVTGTQRTLARQMAPPCMPLHEQKRTCAKPSRMLARLQQL